MTFAPIAIVGRACVLPGALSPAALWDAVVHGRDLTASAPPSRWGLPPGLALTGPGATSADDRTWSDRGGYVEGFDAIFDPTGFAGLGPEEALGLDPLFRWTLHGVREALREAGHDGASERAGLIMGNLSFPSEAAARHAEATWLDQLPSGWLGGRARELAGHRRPDPRDRFSSGLPAHLAAAANGLLGDAFALDAACASALYAIKLACDRLHDGDADLMVAGAVNRADDLFLHVGFCALSALSRTGRSRPFHRDADGLLPAEGAAFVALKRLDDALAAGDRVLGVIRGVGLSNDGRGKGFLAPAQAGQVRALRDAYAASGLAPSDISLLECHATGTPVGDATEVRSLAEVFEGVAEVPLGSLKSNLGHLITAAGAAGLLKVLGAMEAGVRPPTLHVDAPIDALSDTPFRLLGAAEPWATDGPRRAAISAFGFGGNNAHLIVEAPGHTPPAPLVQAPRRAPLAVVGLAARAGAATSTTETLRVALGGPSLVRDGAARAASIPLQARGLRFPPTDLQVTLPQQLLTLALALEATEGVDLPAERTAVYVGMGVDPEIARYGARWRLPGWARAWGAAVGVAPDAAWLEDARDAFAPRLVAAGVVGTMPNIPANRLNRQLGAEGPSFTVASEEASGLVALHLAARALRAGEIDAAVVGASDLSDEPAHRAAASALLPADRQLAGDGGAVLVLERLDDARRLGHPVIAVLDDDAAPTLRLGLADGATALTERLGHAHAASGLLHVAAAVGACRHALRPDGAAWAGERVASVTVDALGAQRVRVTVRAHGDAAPLPEPRPIPEDAMRFPAHAAPIHLAPLPAAPVTHVAATPARGTQPPAPHLPPITEASAPRPDAPTPIPQPTGAAPLPAPQASAAPPQPAAPPRAPAGASEALLHAHADLQARLGAIHRAHIAQQQALHAQFLATRAHASAQLLAAAQAFTAHGAQAPTPPRPTPPSAPAPPLPAPRAAVPTPAIRPEPPAPQAAAKPLSAAPSATPEVVLPGPRWSRAQLEILASGKISDVMGPLFTQQDDFPRQVRMPEPPLLLADRVTGLDAEPGSMKTGTIWTETDITADSWYLHDGRMPAGIMIESGQADLLLISWLGADFENKGERIYRLLGCTLTYHSVDDTPGTVLPGPGETLVYDIHVDGHARQGPIRLFFFHYDCHVDGRRRLSVRGGQAGFFTEAELADSGGILWKPETGEHDPTARLDAPALPTATAFGPEQVRAFADGRPWACFGEAFDATRAHVWPPRISGGDLLFFHEVSAFEPRGGPWGRGYLRAECPVTPHDWFFRGHFKNDPCMPGTLMFEGCIQALSFYLAALGYTVDKDGWRFEPVPDLAYDMRCRGQVTPTSEHLVYEVFVEEVHDGPHPTVFADLLCTVDGLKAFHARRVGLRLVPDWPLSRPEGRALLERGPIPGHIAPADALARPHVVRDGFHFDLRSLVACAWGRPTEAFGPMYAPFDSARRVARLPGPPYHFMTRVVGLDAVGNSNRAQQSVEVAYDIPPDAWYFAENGAAWMPFSVLMEAALQPCGWLASFVGCALAEPNDVLFRNLDGKGTVHRPVGPDDGTLVTRAKLTSLSRSAGMTLVSFEVLSTVGDDPVFEMTTTFGFFPPAAFVDQAGVGTTPQWTEALGAPSNVDIDLQAEPAPFFGGEATLARPMLRMIDHIDGIWAEGGAHGAGRIRAHKRVDAQEWFFKAHFFSDPVQPGSLGVEALCQVLQAWMLHRGLDAGLAKPRFEPVMSEAACTWKYRGQVVPTNAVITSACDIVEEGRDALGPYVVAQGTLWVDGKRIYHLERIGMRLRDGGATSRPGGSHKPTTIGLVRGPSWQAKRPGERVLDPATAPWLADHCPTWTVPALPMTAMLDLLADAAGGAPLVLRDVVVHRWLPLPGPVRIRTEATPRDDGGRDVRLLAWREAASEALSRFEVVASGVAHPDPGPRPPALPALEGGERVPDPYRTGGLFHGPAFQRMTALRRGPSGATATLDATPTGPVGALHPILLDAATHAIPHDDLAQWDEALPEGHAAYPIQVEVARVFERPPTDGTVRCEARYLGAADTPTGPRPRTRLQLIAHDRVIADLLLDEVLLPKGPIGSAPPDRRVAFLRDRAHVPGLGLSTPTMDGFAARRIDIKASDWLPGTVAALYGSADPAEVAARDLVAARAGVHPGAARLDADRTSATTTHHPISRWPIEVEADAGGALARDAGPEALDLGAVHRWWRAYFDLGHWPVEDIYYALIHRFVRRVVLEDPSGFAAIRGRSVLYLANHQVMVESLLFSVLVSALGGVPTVTLAKVEHKQSWLGRLIAHSFAYPGAKDPGVITFFDREDKQSLPRIIGELAAAMKGPGKSAMVHVEGTRSLSCRTPVEKMSSAFIDLALATGSPIVPVRFVGGLPADATPHRLEFPIGHGRQDYVLGAPLLPETLATLPFKERKQVVIDAINATGPRNADEAPLPGDAALESAALAWAEERGVEPAHAALYRVLAEWPDAHPTTRALLAAAAGTAPLDPSAADAAWSAELARRLGGVTTGR